MKRMALLILGIISAVVMGCSNKDNKNRNSGPGPQAATSSPAEVTLTKGDGESMTFSIVVNGETKVSVSGTVRGDMMKPNALSSEDGSKTADVMSIMGKKDIFVVLHGEADATTSSMYLFTEDGDAHTLKINNVDIERNGAIQKILSALEANVDAGMSLDESVSHMVNAFNADGSLTFAAYLDSLDVKGEVTPREPAPPEQPSEPAPAPSNPGSDEDYKDNEGNEDYDDGSDYHDDKGYDDSGYSDSGDQGDVYVPNPAPVPAPAPSYEEPTPRQFPPAIKPKVLAKSKRPKARPTPQKPPQTKPPVYEQPEAAGGRYVEFVCDRDKSSLVVNGENRPLPDAFYGCYDQRFGKDEFTLKVPLDRYFGYLKSIRALDLKVGIDLSDPLWVKTAHYDFKATNYPSWGARWSYEGKQIIVKGSNNVEFTRALTWTGPEDKDPFTLTMMCKVRRTHKANCGR